MNWKKILWIAVFIISSALIAYGLYYFFWRQPFQPLPLANAPAINLPAGTLPTAPTGTPSGQISSLPSNVTSLPLASLVAKGGLTQAPALSSSAAANPSLSSDGRNINFYNPEDEKFYRVGPDGQTQLLSNKIFHNVKDVTWSNQGDKGILEYPDQSKIFFDFKNGRQVTLPKHWEDFSFSFQDNEIAAKSVGLDPENRWLITANPDGTDVKTIFPLGENADKVQVNWSPAGGVIGFSATGQPLGLERKEIITLGKNGETFNPLIVEGLDFQPLWSKKGDWLVYSTFNADSDYKPTLWITQSQGEKMGAGRHKLNLNTWADKCSFFDNTTLYCAAPENLETGAGFAPTLSHQSKDTLYKIDLKTNLKTVIGNPDSGSSMSNLIFSSDGSYLFFTDNNTKQLHKMKLK